MGESQHCESNVIYFNNGLPIDAIYAYNYNRSLKGFDTRNILLWCTNMTSNTLTFNILSLEINCSGKKIYTSWIRDTNSITNTKRYKVGSYHIISESTDNTTHIHCREPSNGNLLSFESKIPFDSIIQCKKRIQIWIKENKFVIVKDNISNDTTDIDVNNTQLIWFDNRSARINVIDKNSRLKEYYLYNNKWIYVNNTTIVPPLKYNYYCEYNGIIGELCNDSFKYVKSFDSGEILNIPNCDVIISNNILKFKWTKEYHVLCDNNTKAMISSMLICNKYTKKCKIPKFVLLLIFSFIKIIII